MNLFFRRLPLPVKLMLVGLVPLALLIYLTLQVYNEKNEKLALLRYNAGRIELSENINTLIDHLHEERKFSFDYALKDTLRKEIVIQRPKTDEYIKKLENSTEPLLLKFTSYTNLDKLRETRERIDNKTITAGAVMHYYSNAIFRLNTLNTIPITGNKYLHTVYKELEAQKLLSEIITYLGMIRSNVYNVLLTRQYMIETLMGTVGTYDVYKSYEEELLVKTSPEISKEYTSIRNGASLKPTADYIDSVFKKFSFDSSFTADTWWMLSNNGINELRNLQKNIWQTLQQKMNILMQKEQSAKDRTLLLLLLALVIVAAIVFYTIHVISRLLKELKLAAQKISKGATGLNIKPASNDVIGDLATSISKIDENNILLANAAAEIGKGNFNVVVKPRSENDVLGNAIVTMKNELQQYSEKMESLVDKRTEELQRSNDDLQQFAHVASHDLKEPLRKIRTFSSRLRQEDETSLSENGKSYLDKIDNASERMYKMIEGVLNYSIVSASEETFEKINLNEVVKGVVTDLEVVIDQKGASVQYKNLPEIKGIPVLIHQLFYNLIFNSLKFSKEGVAPVIEITSRSTAKKEQPWYPEGDAIQYLEIVLKDNGIGFDQEMSEKIFNAFTRLHSHYVYEGTGLGLALCKKIVLLHKGSIHAEGEDGEGAKFYIVLPV